MEENRSKDVIADIINGMSDYTEYHFSAEEEYMIQFSYPEYQGHKKMHAAFINNVNQYKLDLKEGQLMLTVDVASFLMDWLKDHINGIDKKYSAFFNEKGLH